jgi:hypothetical protein
MKHIIATLFLIGMAASAYAVSPYPEKAKPICDEPAKIESGLREKGYFHLLDMKNEQGAVEQLWSGGREMVITAIQDNQVCLVAAATDVTFNPKTLSMIVDIYKKSQKEL